MGYREVKFLMAACTSTEQCVSTCAKGNVAITSGTTSDEVVCDAWGRVVTEDRVDRVPKWWAFTPTQHEERSRVCTSHTMRFLDGGWSTIISWTEKDASGNVPAARKHRQMCRLRTWHHRSRTADSKQQYRKQTTGKADRKSSALGLPTDVSETASEQYDRVTQDHYPILKEFYEVDP